MINSEEFLVNNHFFEESLEDQTEEDYDTNEDIFEIDLNTFYNEKDQPLVRSILKDMGFEFLCFLFEKEKIDFESFRNLNATFILSLLNEYPKGLIIKFHQAYEKWKCQNELNETTNTHKMQENDLQSINSILRESVQGKIFLAKIDRDKPLNAKDRNELISIIVSSILGKRNTISKSEIKKLALMITSEFPNEDISSYINEKTGYGTLYYKFTNKQKALKNSGSKTILGKRKRTETPLKLDEEQHDEQEISSNNFVKSVPANIDYNSLIEHWKKSSKIRLNFFKESSMKSDLTKLYKALERPDGYMLISIDFNTLYPDHLNFYTQWHNYQHRLYAILEHNENEINKFKFLSLNQQAVKILISLNDFLYGPPLIKGNDRSKYRASKLDALKFLLFRCPSENLLELKISEWQTHLMQHSLTKQAFIVCFGETFDELKDKFLVCLNDIIYSFEGDSSIISAIDTLLKIYHVLDIAYPVINQQVYEFLSAKFLGINSSATKMSKGNKVNQLLKLLM